MIKGRKAAIQDAFEKALLEVLQGVREIDETTGEVVKKHADPRFFEVARKYVEGLPEDTLAGDLKGLLAEFEQGLPFKVGT